MAEQVSTNPDRLSPVELEVLAYMEQTYNEKGECPSVDDIFTEFVENYKSVEQVKRATSRTVFKRAMVNRGLKFPVDYEGKILQAKRRLTPQQVNAVAMILDFNDRRSIPEKLKKLNIPTGTWKAWQRDPKFKDYFNRLLGENPETFAVNLQESLFRAVDKGSVDAIKLGYELIGNPIGKSENVATQNLELMVRRLVESIQRHVKDQIILEAIARDFEYIKQGQMPPITPEINPSIEAAIENA